MLWSTLKISPRFSLNEEDVKKWMKNTVLFFAPAALLVLLALQAGKPMEEVLVILKLWGINTAIDILRKFLDGNK